MTPQSVAEWMVEQVRREGCVYQEEIVHDIDSQFGEEFTYTNDNGNLSIDKRVLQEFRKLSGDTIIWERGEKLWRTREPHDDPGRIQE